jgi:hypothetical protein
MNCVEYCCSALVAGPLTTAPAVLNRELWQGHTNWLLAKPVIAHPSCVHVAVSTLNASWPVRAMRKVPSDVCTVAAEVTAARADPLSIVTDTVRPLTVPFTALSWEAEVEEGEVLPPLQAAKVPAASTAAAWQAQAQKSRRVTGGAGLSIVFNLFTITPRARMAAPPVTSLSNREDVAEVLGEYEKTRARQ